MLKVNSINVFMDSSLPVFFITTMLATGQHSPYLHTNLIKQCLHFYCWFYFLQKIGIPHNDSGSDRTLCAYISLSNDMSLVKINILSRLVKNLHKKNNAHTAIRLRLILFSKETGAF
jgi:hypothetical protein